MFKRIWRNPYLLYEITSSNHNQLARDAAGVGHLDYLQHTDFLIYHNEIIRAIIKNGHLHVLQWLCKTRKVVFYQSAMEFASAWNRFEIIKWLYENVVPVVQIQEITNEHSLAICDLWQPRGGHIIENKTLIGFIDTYNNNYNVETKWVTKWVLTHYYLYENPKRHENLEMLKWCYDNSPDFTEYIIATISKNNLYKSLVDWLQENRKNCGNMVTNKWYRYYLITDNWSANRPIAILDILKWLYENHQLLMTKYYIYKMIESPINTNDIEKIKWLYSQL